MALMSKQIVILAYKFKSVVIVIGNHQHTVLSSDGSSMSFYLLIHATDHWMERGRDTLMRNGVHTSSHKTTQE